MHAHPKTPPATVTKLHPDHDFCLVWFKPTYPEDGNGSWVEVVCQVHDWTCGHHHRQWGPIARCASRHQMEVDE